MSKSCSNVHFWVTLFFNHLFDSARVNAAIISGHEEDVGKRTSVYVHTAHSLIQSLMVHKKRGFKQIPTDKVSKRPFVLRCGLLWLNL